METNSLPMTTTVRLIGQQKSGQRATLAYDNNSNLTTKWHQGGNPQTMVYDAADRLTTMQSGGTTGTMSWFSRGAMRNQYETGTIKATYSYTDINNNLRVAQDAAGLTTSTYDGDNLRRKIVSGSVTTTFVWDGSDYLQIKPSTGDATLLIALEGEVVGHVKGSEKRDYIVDPLGSVVAYLNSSQTLTDQFEYWPYGEMVAEIETEVQPFLWVGSLGYFRENELRTYIRAREYRQDRGSWMQLDPLWPATDAIQYGDANPCSTTDPSGLFPTWYCIAACAPVCVGTGGSLCLPCLDGCQAASTLDDLRKVLEKHGIKKGNCNNPKTSLDCWACPMTGAVFERDCKLCCQRLYGDIGDDKDKCDC